MAGNLPAGVSQSDFDQPEPTCDACDTTLDHDGATVTNDGLRLCADHAEEPEHARDIVRHRHGLECQVCHKPMLPSEATSTDPALCDSHDEDDLKAKREHMHEIHREEMEDALADRYRRA